MTSSPSPQMRGAVLLAGAIALVVTLTRLYGELQGWNPTALFNTAPGGGGSPLGISWLVLIFGFWFGRRLAKQGCRPESTGNALALHLLGIALTVGLFALAFNFVSDWRTKGLVINGGALGIGLIALLAWPRAYLANLGAALLARVPVVVIQYLAVARNWDVHFAKGPPESSKEDALFLLTTAQVGMWPFCYSVLVGGLFAVLGAATVKRS